MSIWRPLCVKVKSDRTHPVVLLRAFYFIPSQQSLHGGGASLLLVLVKMRQYGRVGDRHAGGEFKLVPYSGDDEQCPQ